MTCDNCGGDFKKLYYFDGLSARCGKCSISIIEDEARAVKKRADERLKYLNDTLKEIRENE